MPKKRFTNTGERHIPGAWGSTPRSQFVRMIEELEGNLQSQPDMYNDPEWWKTLAGYKQSLAEADAVQTPSGNVSSPVSSASTFGRKGGSGANPIAPGTRNSLASEELLREARGLYDKDSARLRGTNYAPYPGETIPKMSTLTQKARELEQQRIGKPAPYANKLNTLAQRTNQAFTPENLQGIIADLKQRHTNFSQNVTGARLNKQFNAPYAPMQGRFNAKLNKDISNREGEIKGTLDTQAEFANALEEERRQQTYESMQVAGINKAERKNALIKNLNDFGNQKHAINTGINQGRKAQFEDERDEPQRNLEKLRQAIEGSGIEGEEHPDLLASRHRDLTKSLRAYGIDPSKPSNEWDTTRPTKQGYRGEIVAGINPELQSSYDMLENISPKYRDAHYDQRKGLERELLSQKTVGQKFLTKLPSYLQSEMDKLERSSKRQAKEDMNALNRKYIRQGTYRSQDHMSAADRRMREINDSTMEQRIDLLGKGFKSGLLEQHQSESDKIKQMNRLGTQGQQEYADMFGSIRGINDLGAKKWKNKQDENEEMYKNYTNERAAEWPAIQANARKTGYGQGEKYGYGQGEQYGHTKGVQDTLRTAGGITLEELSKRASYPYKENELEISTLKNQAGKYMNEINSKNTFLQQLTQQKAQIEAQLASRAQYVDPATHNQLIQQKAQIEAQLAQARNETQTIRNQFAGYVSPAEHNRLYQDQLAQKEAIKNQFASYVHPSSYQELMNQYNVVRDENNKNYDALARTPGSRMEFHRRF